ncbi:MAG: DUF4363 family protein [Christensenellales bacterium]
MTKKLISVLALIVVVGFAGFFESNYIIKSFDYLNSELIQVMNDLSADPEHIDTKENVDNLKAIHTNWQKHTKVLKFFVWHTGIKEVEVGLSRITSYTEENDYTEAYVELNNLIDYCNHYSEDYRFSLQNII